MTFIAALEVSPPAGDRAILALTDSRSVRAGFGYKGEPWVEETVQKLVPIGRSLIMGTGKDYCFEDAREAVRRKKPIYAGEVARTLLEVAEYYEAARRDAEPVARCIVAGQEPGGGLGIYRIVLAPREARSAPVPAKLAIDGSGSALVFPYGYLGTVSFKRTLSEGLSQLVEWGKKAAEDSGVNRRFQLGLVTPKSVKVLCPKSVYPRHDVDIFDYVQRNMGVSFSRWPAEYREVARPHLEALNKLYWAIRKSASDSAMRGNGNSRRLQTLLEIWMRGGFREIEAEVYGWNRLKPSPAFVPVS